jgi:hypothetical protein
MHVWHLNKLVQNLRRRVFLLALRVDCCPESMAEIAEQEWMQ